MSLERPPCLAGTWGVESPCVYCSVCVCVWVCVSVCVWLGGSFPMRVHGKAAGAHMGMGAMSPPPQEVLLPSLVREATSFTLRIQTSSLVQKRKSY